MSLGLALTVLGCRAPEPPAPQPIEVVPPTHVDVGWWRHEPPIIEGGEVILGVGGRLEVYPAPAGAEVQLYRGFLGQGAGPCTYPGGLCSGLLDPELHATATADEEGVAEFLLDDTYVEAGPVLWQAVVLDPDLAGVAATTEAIARHVGVHPSEARTRIEEVTIRAGLLNTFTSGNTHSGGVAFVDLNGDHWPDLYVSNGSGLPNLTYRNAGDGTFVPMGDVLQKPDPAMECAGVKAADVDNDGDLDLIVPVDNAAPMLTFVEQSPEGGPNLMWINHGDWVFEETAEASGILDPRGVRNSSAAVADYDRDGCIDVYLTHWAMASLPAGNNPDRLLKGNCDGTFDDVTAAMGVDGKGRDGLVGFWWDADFDLYPELFVGNNSDLYEPPDFDPTDVLYRNRGGTSFVADPDLPGGGDAWAAMGIDIGDIDADGDWDMYITDVWFLPPVPHGNALYLGEPDGSLSANACQEKGVCFGYNSWATNFEDFDNDGWVDLWVGSSLPWDPNMLYLNRGDGSGRFEAHRQTGFDGHTTRAGTIADYDGDGDMDIFLFDESASSSLWMNHLMDDGFTDRPRHWVQLKLIGTDSNRAAIGAVARLTTAGGPPQMRRVTGGDSAHSHRDLTLHFGLGEAQGAETIEITWPSGRVQTFEDVPGDRFYLAREDIGLVHHQILEPQALYDAAAGTVTVFARSNYGGRAPIEVDGLGPLTYHSLDVTWRGQFAVASRPAQLLLASDYGGDVVIPVQ